MHRIFLLLLLTTVPAWGDFVEVPGGKLWYESRGEGPPLILLHDGFASSGTWDAQMPAFARLFRTIRYDRRGYGRTESNREPYSHLDDLATFLDTLKIDRAVLVGCDNGARLALDYALAHPERVSALVLVGPVVSGFPFSEHFLRRGTANYRPMFQNQSVDGWIEAWIQDPHEIDPANTRARERLRELFKTFPSPLSNGFPDSRPPDKPAAGRLGEVHVPTLIVVGASDIADIHAQAGALESGISGAHRVVLPGAGHLAYLERPDLFNETVLTFLRPDDAAASYLKSLAGDRTFEQSRGLFDYDKSAPLDVKEAGTETRGAVRVIDLSYASPLGGRVPAWLVLPAGSGKHPAVVWLHPGQGDRSTFLDEAVTMAGRGLVSLLIGGPFTRPENPRSGNPFDPEASRKIQIQGIVDVRRGFDLLVSRPEVDPKRLAYVGHSYGATIGGTLAAVERRPVAHVLMAGFPSLTHSWTDGHNQDAIAFQTLLLRESQDAYVKDLAPVDAVHYVGHAAPAKLFFQFARHDELISEWDAAVYTQAASEPKEVKWYDSDHFFNDEARKDRDEWLAKVLGL